LSLIGHSAASPERAGWRKLSPSAGTTRASTASARARPEIVGLLDLPITDDRGAVEALKLATSPSWVNLDASGSAEHAR
jgi:hypothetical protein